MFAGPTSADQVYIQGQNIDMARKMPGQASDLCCMCRIVGSSSVTSNRPSTRRSLGAQTREGRLVLGVDGGRVITTTTSAAEVVAATALTTSASTTALTTSTSTAALTASTATLATGTTTGTTTSAMGTVGLNVTLVNVENLLLLALTLTLGLGGSGGNEVGLFLDKSLGAGPLLISLAALVGLADVGAATKSQLLLGQLGEVLGVGDALVLLLLGNGISLGILSGSLLQLRLGNSLASLLILGLSFAFLSTPALGSLLLGAAGSSVS